MRISKRKQLNAINEIVQLQTRTVRERNWSIGHDLELAQFSLKLY